MQLSTYDNNTRAELHSRYLNGVGGLFLQHVTNKLTGLYGQFARCSSPEAAHLLAGLLNHGTELDITTADTDSIGDHTLAIGLGWLLGFTIRPRIKRIKYHKLVKPAHGASFGKIDPMFSRCLNTKLIEENYDEVVHLVCSLAEKTVSSELVIKRFNSFSRKSGLHQALLEIGRAVHTIFVARYLEDEDLRREIHRNLCHGEAWNGMTRQIFSFNRAVMRENDPDEQERIALSLLLVQTDWHVREDTILKAEAVLANFVLHRSFSKYWGDGTKSSSDGMRIKVGVRAANAVRNQKHFGVARGVTVYTHVGDIGLPFGQKVISTNDREALYVIDALCNHETDLNIQEHYTDTHGYTEHVFALCSLLGFKFAPRIANLMEQRLFTLGPPDDYGDFNKLIKGRVSTSAIVQNWDEILRLAASIKNGTVSASLIMRKLAAYPRQNTLAKALADVGKIEKTLFVLEYISDPAMRRRVLKGLNKGESLHSVARSLFFGRQGELWERAYDDQFHRTSCLNLLVAAIAAWNTVYLERAITSMREAGEPIPDEYLPHFGNHGYEHINLLGRYNFDPREARAITDLRPLRTESEIEEAVEGEL